jgi:hypothetical protein
VPEQPAPDHPANVEPEEGVAVRVTAVASAKVREHSGPQSIPFGELVTEPEPVPDFVTLRAWTIGAGLNVAVTAESVFSVTAQLPAPEQPPPDQPLKIDPDAGVAVSVTVEPFVKGDEQAMLQSIPAGLLVTEPLPTVETLRLFTPTYVNALPSESTAAQNVGEAHETEASPCVSMLAGALQALPLKVIALPLLSTAAQNDDDEQETEVSPCVSMLAGALHAPV